MYSLCWTCFSMFDKWARIDCTRSSTRGGWCCSRRRGRATRWRSDSTAVLSSSILTVTLDRDARPGRTVVLDARPRIPLSPTQILYMYANANCKFTTDLAWTDKAVGPRKITFALAGRLDCMGAGHIQCFLPPSATNCDIACAVYRV